MDQPTATAPRGKIAAYLNRSKQPGDRQPVFVDGGIAKPGTEEQFPLTLWAFTYTDKSTGEVLTGFNGTIGALPNEASAMQQVEFLQAPRPAGDAIETHGLSIKPGQVLIFVSKPKPDGKENQKTHYGYANFGDGSPLVEASLWLDKDR